MSDTLTLTSHEAGSHPGGVRRELQEIARAEFGRQRRRLGELTPEQERAIETLLLATADRIAHPVIAVMSLAA